MPPSCKSNVTALVPKSSNLYLFPESETTFTVYVIAGDAPPADQFQETYNVLLAFVAPSAPRVKPSLPKAVKPSLSSISASVKSVRILLIAPLTVSYALVPDVSFLSSIGYKPQVSLQEGLNESYEWYLNYFKNNKL